MSNPVKGMGQLLKRLSGTSMKQRRMAGTIAGGIAGAASTPTKEDGTNSENFTRKALGGLSGAVLGNRLGNFATNNNISRGATKAGGAAQKAHTKIMDSKLNDKVKNFAGGAFDKASRGANQVNKNFEVAPTTMTPVNTVADAVPVSFYDANIKKTPSAIKLLGPGKTTTASDFVDYLFEKVASEELEVKEFNFKKKV